MTTGGSAAVHISLGLTNARQGWMDKAAECFRQAVELDPGSSQAHHYLGVALLDLGRFEQAVAVLDMAIATAAAPDDSRPPLVAALRALGGQRRREGRIVEAEAALARAAAIDPHDPQAALGYGVTLILRGHYADAQAQLERATRLDPECAPAWYNLGIVCAVLGRLGDALAAFDRALAIDPGYEMARVQRPFIQARQCDWPAIERDGVDFANLGIEGPVLPPFALLPFEDDPPRHRIRSERAAAALDLPPAPVPPPPTARPRQLRIGYVSADFRDHATMHLAGRMFELHDRDRFAVHGYSLGRPVDDPVRRRVERGFDHFTDVDGMDDSAVAAMMRDHCIDIAVDMLGYTAGSRPAIFGHRAAPIQMSFLGFPGTSGAPFIDYLVADPVVIPVEERGAYSEALLRLPHSYQVNDDTRRISDRPVTRSDAGLPETGFVFCCFNNVNKIKPLEFAIWMRLLGEVEGSVLWLLAGSEASRANLRAAARRHGIDPARLVFATSLPLDEHLARHRLADLFVDTFNYNAHTTASDALWAGLPLVTKAGRGFAARVAASLLHAIGLDELITTSDDDYFALALELARDPQRLGAVRQKLAANRLSQPLFDTALFVRHIEAGFDAAYRRYLDGLPPADIAISP